MVTSYSTRPTRLRRGVSGAYEDTLYTYNAAGELASVMEPGATTPTTFDYDELGRMTRACHNSGCTEHDEVTYDVLRGRVATKEAVNASGSVERVYSYGAATQVQDPMPTTTLPNADRVVELEELTHTGMMLTDSNGVGADGHMPRSASNTAGSRAAPETRSYRCSAAPGARVAARCRGSLGSAGF